IISLIGFCSCKKDLTIPNPNTPTTENFWKTANDAQLGINAIYSTFHREGLSRWLYFMTMIRSDEGYSTSPNPDIVNTYDVFHITDYNDYLVTSVWQDDYIGINRANQVLDKVPSMIWMLLRKHNLLQRLNFYVDFFITTWQLFMVMCQ